MSNLPTTRTTHTSMMTTNAPTPLPMEMARVLKSTEESTWTGNTNMNMDNPALKYRSTNLAWYTPPHC